MQERGKEIFVHKSGVLYPVTFTASPIRRDGAAIGTVIEVMDARPQNEQDAIREALHQLGLLILQELDHEKIVQAVTDMATRLTGAEFGAFFYNVRNEAGESYTLYTIAGVPKEHFSKFPLPRNTPLFGPTFNGLGTIRSDDIRRDPRYGHAAPDYGMPPGHLPVCSYLAVPVKLGDGEVIGGLFLGHQQPAVFKESHEELVETLAAQAAIGMNKATLYREALYARQRAEQEAIEKQRLYEEAARANEVKDQFLATVSHELRTPLTSILGWAQMLTSGKLSGTMMERAVNTIERNARAQAQIVEDLLDISRIVSGKLCLNVQLFSPNVAVEAAIDALRPAALAKSVNLQVVIDPRAGPISGDPERLQQIIWNLLANAVKFTPKGGRVHVALQRDHSNVQIVVTDNGAGIPPDYLPRVFDNFTQVDSSSSRKHNGLGLGLAIVKKLAELHGGTVHAHSDGVDKGASFTVNLPVAPIAYNHALPAAARRDGTSVIPHDTTQFGLSGVIILLVEDDEDARGMLASVLGSAHAVVETASNAEEALLLWESIKPDMIVSDVGMPGMDGCAFIMAIRERELLQGRPPVPAVALTAYARVQDRMRALTSGFQMHVAKPVEPAELLTVLSTLRTWHLP